MPSTPNREAATSPQCEANVWVRPGYWHKFQCKRLAKDEVAGVPFCTQHAVMAREKGLTYVT